MVGLTIPSQPYRLMSGIREVKRSQILAWLLRLRQECRLQAVSILRESIYWDRKQFPVFVGDDQLFGPIPAYRFALAGFDFLKSGGSVQIVPTLCRSIENPYASGGQYS